MSDKIEVGSTEQQEGKVEVFTKQAFKGDTPSSLARGTKIIRYFCTGLITLVGATDLFSGRQAKIIVFILGVTILATGAIDAGTGVVSDEASDSKRRNH